MSKTLLIALAVVAAAVVAYFLLRRTQTGIVTSSARIDAPVAGQPTITRPPSFSQQLVTGVLATGKNLCLENATKYGYSPTLCGAIPS